MRSVLITFRGLQKCALLFLFLGVVAVAQSPEEANSVTTKHLKAVLRQSSSSVRPGQPVSLTAQITLENGMHVYAPGVESPYRPIKIEFAPDQRVRISPIKYPEPKTLYLKPIDETVPVFEGTFNLQTSATLRARTVGPLEIRANLTYQTCDDRICYRPQTVPLSWKITVIP